MGEFQLIDAFVAELPHRPSPRGPGDDAAVLGRLCVTTDALVEGVHFTRPAFTLADVGWKALATNLSDLAAMGARPAWWLCALGLPKGFTGAQARRLAGGMRPLAERYRLELAGGNVTSSPVLTVTLTLAGTARRPMLRSLARPHQLIYVAGELGEATDLGSRAQRRPLPLVEEGLLAARYASACVDVSDGLLQDLAHVCTASGVGAALDSRRLPARRGLPRALGGGEDYALVMAVPARRALALERAWRRAQARVPLTRVGAFTQARGLLLDGRPVRPRGFDHLRARGDGSLSGTRVTS